MTEKKSAPKKPTTKRAPAKPAESKAKVEAQPTAPEADVPALKVDAVLGNDWHLYRQSARFRVKLLEDPVRLGEDGPIAEAGTYVLLGFRANGEPMGFGHATEEELNDYYEPCPTG